MRQKAIESQKLKLKSEIRSKVKIRVLGDPEKPAIGSLKGTLLNGTQKRDVAPVGGDKIMSSVIPFIVPIKYLAGLQAGEFTRSGALLKDASNGQIVAHLQETGLVHKILQAGLSFDPSGTTDLIGVVQNAAISSKLNVMQQALGTIQILQYASLFSSVAGIGSDLGIHHDSHEAP